jgi:hypothetical protein
MRFLSTIGTGAEPVYSPVTLLTAPAMMLHVNAVGTDHSTMSSIVVIVLLANVIESNGVTGTYVKVHVNIGDVLAGVNFVFT